MSKIVDILRETGALIIDDHFVLTSGKHSPLYINKDALYPHTDKASEVGRLIADKLKDFDIDVVAGPALGGIILAQWVAYHLSKLKKKKILGVYTEKDLEKNQVFKRGYDKLVKGKKVIVVEDLTTTGNSVRKVINSVLSHGGKVVGVAVMVNRDPRNVNEQTIGFPFYMLDTLDTQSYEEKDCPLCKKHVPVNTDVGHGRKFVEKNPQ